MLSEHETFLKQLQEQCSEDERDIQLVEKLDEELLRTEIAHATISSHLLKNQLHSIPSRVAGVKS